MTDEDERLHAQSYQKEGAQKAKTLPEFFKAQMRNSILDTGLYQSNVVDAEMKKIDADSIPEPLRKAYFAMISAGLKSRLANDEDYKQLVAKNPDKYEFLRQL